MTAEQEWVSKKVCVWEREMERKYDVTRKDEDEIAIKRKIVNESARKRERIKERLC